MKRRRVAKRTQRGLKKAKGDDFERNDNKRGRVDDNAKGTGHINLLPPEIIELIFTYTKKATDICNGRLVCSQWYAVLSKSPLMTQKLKERLELYLVMCWSITRWNGWNQQCDHAPVIVWAPSRNQVGRDIIRNYSTKWQDLLWWQEFEQGEGVETRLTNLQRRGLEGDRFARRNPWGAIEKEIEAGGDYDEGECKRITVFHVGVPRGSNALQIVNARGIPDCITQFRIINEEATNEKEKHETESEDKEKEKKAKAMEEQGHQQGGGGVSIHQQILYHGINVIPSELLLKIFQELHAGSLSLCREVCKQWKDILNSHDGLELFLGKSRLYVVSPYMLWDTYEGETDHAPIIARGFSRRHVVCDVIKRYREKWQHLLHWDDDDDGEKIRNRFMTLQDEYNCTTKDGKGGRGGGRYPSLRLQDTSRYSPEENRLHREMPDHHNIRIVGCRVKPDMVATDNIEIRTILSPPKEQ